MSPEEALISWEAPQVEDQNGIITGYVIDITLPGIGMNFQVTTSNTDFLLDELLPFTTYTWRVAAMTSVGLGPYSMATSFLTSEGGKYNTQDISHALHWPLK